MYIQFDLKWIKGKYKLLPRIARQTHNALQLL